jgi:hypothetical protein
MKDLNGWVIFLSIVASFITILLTLIGVLMKYGIDAIRGDIQSIWEWIKESDRHKLHMSGEIATLKSEMKSITETVKDMAARCSEIHMSGGKRWSDPMIRPIIPSETNENG